MCVYYKRDGKCSPVKYDYVVEATDYTYAGKDVPRSILITAGV